MASEESGALIQAIIRANIEVLTLHLEDIQYGRRRVIIRYRTDHPKGVRTKSRRERVVDLHEPETLTALSDYVMHERPTATSETTV